MNIQIPSHEEIQKAFAEGEEAILALFDKFESQVEILAEQLKIQAAAIKELQAKAAKNSSNSSKPPSSDGYNKKNRTASQREKGQKPNGGQPRHKGATLNPVENPDEVEVHDKDCCGNCAAFLTDVPVSKVEERQIFDIPAMKITVTSHQATLKVCPECQTENKGDFPKNVSQPVQYGDGVKTVATYFTTGHFMPVERTVQIFKDLFGQSPSEAFILNAGKQLEQIVNPPEPQSKSNCSQRKSCMLMKQVCVLRVSCIGCIQPQPINSPIMKSTPNGEEKPWMLPGFWKIFMASWCMTIGKFISATTVANTLPAMPIT